jgi:hypothetical protein
MKKLLVLASLLFLTACSEPLDTVSDSMPMGEIKQEKEIMKKAVHIYSLTQNSEGTIIHWDERDKWLIVPASVVVEHPKALVETSNGQLLEGTVTYIDTELNTAIVHFRNSAILEEKKLDLNEASKTYKTFSVEDKEITLTVAQMEAFIQSLNNKGVPFEERTEARAQLQAFPSLIAKPDNKIENYEKETFSFDRDAIQLQVNEFVKQYNAYVNEQENALFSMIANDEVKKIFLEWEAFGEKFTFFEPEVTSISYEGFLYRGQFQTKMGEKDPKEVNVALAFMKENETYRIVTFAISEK